MGRKSAKRISRVIRELHERDLDASPFEQLNVWLQEAVEAKVVEPTAMVLATVDGRRPSARVVLLKAIDERGIVFFTNYQSRKAVELDANPNAALVFYWSPIGRQVRVEGTVSRVGRAETEAYFVTRPRMSQIGAWASHQSERLTDRATLDRSVEEFEAKFHGKDIPAPPFWGGFRLVPAVFEFWQSRDNRLHDRLRYSHSDNRWIIDRLSP